MDFPHARRVASRLGLLTHRAAVCLAFQKQFIEQGGWAVRIRLLQRSIGLGLLLSCGLANAETNLTQNHKASSKAATPGSGLDPCDLNGDGVVDLSDAQLAVSMSLGQVPCTANIDGLDVCNVLIVQRVVNASTTGTCITGNSHVVALSWTASTSSNVAGYDVFRGVSAGGPYTQLNSSLVPILSYTDNNVQPGQSYFYVTASVDTNNNQSVYSNEVPATVPSP